MNTLGWVILVLCSLPAGVFAMNLEEVLKHDLQGQSTPSFSLLIHKWEMKYGSQAFKPLITLASDQKNPDTERYIALMGAVKLGGTNVALRVLPFLKDPSWMLRSGALRALAALHDQKTAQAILPLLNDSALVVRAEAVEAIQTLRPNGAVEALVSAIEDDTNYHGGKAQWVPNRALIALAKIQAKEAAPRLIPLLHQLKHKTDLDFLTQTVRTLQTLTGKLYKTVDAR